MKELRDPASRTGLFNLFAHNQEGAELINPDPIAPYPLSGLKKISEDFY